MYVSVLCMYVCMVSTQARSLKLNISLNINLDSYG